MAKKTNKLSSLTTKPIAVKIVNDSPKAVPYREDDARERKWKAEDALRTCKEYEKIKTDKQLMGDVKKLAKEEMSKLQKVTGK
jgi:uncharacterized protein (DUF169 family)